MAEVRPLSGVRYNSAVVSDLAEVICPPYDIISTIGQKSLYDNSPYNFVRIEYGEVLAGDDEVNNKYLRASASLQSWLSQGVLTQDDSPVFYVHDHYFTYHGKDYHRRGLTCRVRLEEWSQMVVRPHENTMAAHRGDRIRLLGTLGANTSPVLSMYRDESGTVAQIMAGATTGAPLAAASLCEDERHELFSISNGKAIEGLEMVFAEKPLYIADGHHRYESALAYQRECRARYPDAPPDAPFNYVLMTLIDMDDPDLLILPAHRLIRGLDLGMLAGLEVGLSSFFKVERMAPGALDAWGRLAALPGWSGEQRLVLVGPGDLLRVLTLRDFEAVSPLIPGEHTDIYKKMDVSMVDHIVLESVLGIKSDDEAVVSFCYDRAEAMRRVLDGDCQLAFIVQPVRPVVIKDVADAGDRMPRKSTYFYPKLPSGLLMNRVV